MTTTRNIILSTVANTPTTVYTNSTGKTAILKSMNINGIGDSQTLNTVTGADEWIYHGTNQAPIIPPGFRASNQYGYGVPLSIPLSADKLLLVWNSTYMHNLGEMDISNNVHMQVVEYTNGKYRAGPIVNAYLTVSNVFASATGPTVHTSPSGVASNTGGSCLKGVALTSTKVVLAFRYSSVFAIHRVTINGNTPELSNITTLSVTGQFSTTAKDFDIVSVPDTTDQVMVWASGASFWQAAAYSVPNSGALSQLGSTYTTSLTQTTYPGSICRTANSTVAGLAYFTAVGSTTTTAASIQLFSYNISTYAFTTINTNNITSAGSAWYSIKAQCLSSDGTPNAVVMTVDPSNGATIYYYRQTSLSTVSVAQNIGTFNGSRSASTRSIRQTYRWGNSRAIFQGDNCLCVVDSSGTFTDLISSTADSTNTSDYYNLWYNFESRPLYSFYDPGSIDPLRPAHYHARTGMTSSTSVGTRTGQGNYFPWGHDYGNHYGWSDQAGCWIVAQYGKLYAISVDGDILSEVSLDTLFPDLTTNTYAYDIRNVYVLPSGKILFSLMSYSMTTIGYTFFVGTNWTGWGLTTGYACVTQPILNAKDLNKAVTQNYISLSTPACTSHLIGHVDFNGDERAYLIWHSTAAAPVTVISQYYNGGWVSSTTTSVGSTTAGSWNRGYNGRLKLIQAYPCTAQYPRGLWRFIGPIGTSSLANIRSLYVGALYDPFTQASSMACSQSSMNDGSSVYSSYGVSCKSSNNITVVADWDAVTAGAPTRVWASIEGRLNYLRGWYSSANSTNAQYTTTAVSNRAYLVAHNNTTNAANIVAQVHLFDTIDFANTRVTIANTSNSGFYTLKRMNDTTVEVYNAANSTNAVTDAVYTITGPTDRAKATITITSGSNTFFVANQTISASNTTFVRINDSYLLGNGNYIQVYADKPYALSAMLNIVEE